MRTRLPESAARRPHASPENPALAEEFPGQTWFHPSGSVAWRKTSQDREAMIRNFERLRSLGTDVVAPQVQVGEVDEALKRLRPLGADVVAPQVQVGEIDEALELLRALVPDAVAGQVDRKSVV